MRISNKEREMLKELKNRRMGLNRVLLEVNIETRQNQDKYPDRTLKKVLRAKDSLNSCAKECREAGIPEEVITLAL